MPADGWRSEHQTASASETSHSTEHLKHRSCQAITSGASASPASTWIA